jgi:hypothetical protein
MSCTARNFPQVEKPADRLAAVSTQCLRKNEFYKFGVAILLIYAMRGESFLPWCRMYFGENRRDPGRQLLVELRGPLGDPGRVPWPDPARRRWA